MSTVCPISHYPDHHGYNYFHTGCSTKLLSSSSSFFSPGKTIEKHASFSREWQQAEQKVETGNGGKQFAHRSRKNNKYLEKLVQNVYNSIRAIHSGYPCIKRLLNNLECYRKPRLWVPKIYIHSNKCCTNNKTPKPHDTHRVACLARSRKSGKTWGNGNY